MSSNEILFKAAINRLTARFVEKLSEAPEALQKEWEIFQEEVIEEADRLQKESQESPSTGTSTEPPSPKQQIDKLRSKVADLNQKLEGQN